MKKLILVIMLFVSSGLLIACGDNQQDKVVIASKPMTEQYIIVHMLTYLIEDNSDLQVEQKLGIGGGTSNIHPGMVSGSIDMYPEYTGTGWLFVLEEELISDPTELYQEVKTAYQEDFNIVWSGLYGFNNTYGLAMEESMAESLDISTYTELADESPNLTLGAEYDFYEREDGYPGLEETYGFNFENTTELDIGLKYQAISSGSVDVINIFSTDGRLEEFNLTVLEDDQNFFPSYHAATLVRQEILDEYPILNEILAMLEGEISDEDMTRMNYLVDIENQDPQDVAREFLEEKGLM
ncbi:MAG: glycine betaine ABC transporter substrate-binding protein [Candidatus Izemoplasmatales bacterium]